ncbi:MAG: response regulator [Methylococcales bacterium]
MIEKLKESKRPKHSKRPVLFWIDDNRSLRRIARLIFANSDFKCVTARSGSEGIRMLDKVNPDLILLDIEMPRINGFETCNQIQAFHKESGCKTPPILMVSSHKNIGHLNRAFDLGIIDIVPKPINWKLLVNRIRYILNTNNDSETQNLAVN